MASLFGPATNADRIRLQRRTLNVLDAMLRSAEAAGLPPLRWSLISTGTLHGQCFDFGTEERRGTFDAWVSHLGATRSPEWTGLGATHLRAAATAVHGHAVRLAITAELLPVDDDGGYDR